MYVATKTRLSRLLNSLKKIVQTKKGWNCIRFGKMLFSQNQSIALIVWKKKDGHSMEKSTLKSNTLIISLFPVHKDTADEAEYNRLIWALEQKDRAVLSQGPSPLLLFKFVCAQCRLSTFVSEYTTIESFFTTNCYQTTKLPFNYNYESSQMPTIQ